MPERAAAENKEVYEFGPFCVDAERETLVRAGQAVPLTPKSFQVLLVLVRHSRDVVTKDELLNAVWPDTFVEEGNLTRSIFMLRKALGESSKDHRYIITVPGRGYRLAETVHSHHELSLIAATYSTTKVEVVETQPAHAPRNVRVVAITAISAVAAVAGLFAITKSIRKPPLTPKDTIVLADVVNSTGDKVFDTTLRQGIAVQLGQSSFLNLVSDPRIGQTLKLMGRSPDTPLTPELAREVCERTGSAAVLEGSIAPIGSSYALGLLARDCHTGEVMDQEQVQANRKEAILDALSTLSIKLRKRIGESLSSLNKHNAPLATATTSSLEALSLYSAGWKVLSTTGAMTALPLFQRATEIDPSFAMAHTMVGRLHADLDESELAAKDVRKAWELRDRASDRERFLIEVNYSMLGSGNLEAAQQTCEAWVQAYPQDPMPRFVLSGYINKVPGRFEKALSAAREGLALDPDFAIGYYNVGVNQAYLNRFADARATLTAALARGLENDELVMLEYDLALLKGDEAAADRAVAHARERVAAGSWVSARQASVLAYDGRLRLSRDVTRRAVEEAQQAGLPERAALWMAGAAVREAFLGNHLEARREAAAALASGPDREVEYAAALAFALSGDIARAKSLSDDLQQRFPDDTSVRFSYLPVVRALIALNQGKAAEGIDLLQTSAPYDLGVPRSSIHGLFGALYPVYVRGLAELAAGQPDAAAADFRTVLEHPGIVVRDPVGALARLQLARAYARSGDVRRARSSYQLLFGLWQNADTDLPVLAEARAEDDRLH